MAVHDLFSKRQTRLRGDTPDVYVYDEIPQKLRAQIIHIYEEAVGTDQVYHYELSQQGKLYKVIVDALCREYGVFCLSKQRVENDYLRELNAFVLSEQDPERVLDAVELTFRAIDRIVRGEDIYPKGAREADAAISELNDRFKENGVGYQYVDGDIVRVDSDHIHSNVVLPALTLLRSADYAGAEHEFRGAHEHYRNGRCKEALVDALKAIESTIKTICDKQKWHYDPKATCKDLINTCFENELIPKFWSAHFSAMRSTLEAGVPTVRNKLGGHGQGATVTEVPDFIAAYALHMAAAAIVFLVQAEKNLP